MKLPYLYSVEVMMASEIFFMLYYGVKKNAG